MKKFGKTKHFPGENPIVTLQFCRFNKHRNFDDKNRELLKNPEVFRANHCVCVRKGARGESGYTDDLPSCFSQCTRPIDRLV